MLPHVARWPCRTFILMVLVSTTMLGWSTASDSKIVYTWEEIVPGTNEHYKKESSSIDTRLPRTQKATTLNTLPPPHPLRTNKWELRVRWRRKNKRAFGVSDSTRTTTLILELNVNGFARVGVYKHSKVRWWRQVGEWKLHKPTLQVHITFPDSLLMADFHENSFGRFPKLTRGTVRDMSWRPILATFRGRGVGAISANA